MLTRTRFLRPIAASALGLVWTLFGTWLTCLTPARAQWSGARGQYQLTVAAGPSMNEVGFGIFEVGAEGSLNGFGLVGALGYERVPRSGITPVGRGGFGLLCAELRPVVFADSELYRRFDLQVLVGGRFGAVTDGDSTDGRSSFVLGLGADIGLNDYGDSQWIASIRYRHEPARPYADAGHYLLVGFGFRFLDASETNGSSGWH